MTAFADWHRSPTARALVALAVFATGLWYFAVLDLRFAVDPDEASVTYRYAQNLADGAGFVDKPGERVLGTSTPLFTLILAVAARLGISIPTASASLGVVCAALALALAVVWLFRLTNSSMATLLGALLLCCTPTFVVFAVSGMETSLYVLAILGAFALYDSGRLHVAALVAAMAALVRLDGMAVGAALLIHFAATRRRLPPPTVLAAYALPLLPWVLFSWLYFGTVVPRSMPVTLQHAMTTDRWWALEMWPLWALALVGILLPLLRRTATPAGVQALAIWTVAYVAAFSAFRIDLHLWHLSPLTAALVILSVFGATQIFKLGETTTPRAAAGVPMKAIGFALVMAPLLILGGYRTSQAIAAMAGRANTVQRAGADAAAPIRREDPPVDLVSLRFVSGLAIESVSLRADRLEIVTSVDRPQDRNYKFFVHLYEDGKQDGTPTRLYDFYPVVATSKMTPGVRYSSSTAIVPVLSSPLSIVTVGLFDESDPAYKRLADAKGQSQIVLKLPAR